MSEQVYGIKETLEVIDFGLALAEGVVDSLEDDGKVTFGDLTKFGKAGMLLMPAITDIALVPKELGDLSPEEAIVIRDHILAKLPNLGDKWGIVARDALQIGLSTYSIYTTVKAAR